MQRPILVTGSHRSGTTWVGRTLAAGGDLAYLDEPFHPRHRRGTCAARPRFWYQYVTERNEAADGWGAALRSAFSFRYQARSELADVRGLRDLARLARDWSRFASARRRGARPLMKDPLAFFSAPWISGTFQAQVVVLTRHPAAFASSLKRLGWTFDVGNWLDQPELVDDLLGPWRQELEEFRRSPGDVVDQAALCWKVIAGVTLGFQVRHPDWIFVRHEDLSRDPEAAFRDLCRRLALPYTEATAASLRETTSSGNPAEAPAGRAHALKRDSRENISNWKQRLTAGEIARIRTAVAEIAPRFYSDVEW